MIKFWNWKFIVVKTPGMWEKVDMRLTDQMIGFKGSEEFSFEVLTMWIEESGMDHKAMYYSKTLILTV